MAAAPGFRLPQFIVVKPFKQVEGGYNVYYKKNEDGSEGGGIALGSETEFSVFSPLVKIEAERATSDKKYVNIRFCCSNRYWERVEGSDNIAAPSTIPKEDTSQYSCTLFEPHQMSDPDPSNGFYLKHVNSGRTLALIDKNTFTLIDSNVGDVNYLTFVDWETLVQLPEHVAFKGDNGKYLKAFYFEESGFTYKHLQLGETDPNKLLSGHTVHQFPDGYVRILSDFSGQFWNRSFHSNWVLTDSFANDADTLFWPIKIDGNTIALRNKGNGKFCHRLTDGSGRTDFLSSTADTITADSKMQVEELVLDRKIYYVDYRMEDARIFDEQPYLAGSSLLINATDDQTSQSVTITYQNDKSYTFSRGLSVTAGVSTTIKAGIPFIAEGKIEISLEITGNFQWDTTTTTTTSVSATGSVNVPPRSSVIVEYVGTQGSCSIPYSYTQLDKSATDGQIKRTEMNDGTYTGVSCYNFNFKMSAPKAMMI